MTTPPESELERMLARLAALQPDSEAADHALARVAQALERASLLHRRQAMKVRIAVAAVVILAVGGLLLLTLGKSAAPAFASVQKRVEKTRSISATQTTYVGGKPTEKGTMRLLKEGLLRYDESNSNYIVVDMNKRQWLTVDAQAKQAILQHNAAPRAPMDLYDQLRKLSDKATRALGERDLAGNPAAGFIVPFENDCGKGDLILWVDLKTGLPIRIEFSGRDEKGREAQQIIDDIVFDQPIEPRLFSLEPPAEYQLVQQGVDRPVPPAAKDTLELVLTPGVGLGPVKFGMSKKEVIDALGEPDIIERNTSLNYLSRGYSFMVSPQRGVIMIQCYSQATFLAKVTDFAGKTAENIKLGASRKEIENAYGAAGAVDIRNQATTNLDYRQHGISFVLANDKLVQITASKQ